MISEWQLPKYFIQLSPVIPNKPNCTNKKKKKLPWKFRVCSCSFIKIEFFTSDPNSTAPKENQAFNSGE